MNQFLDFELRISCIPNATATIPIRRGIMKRNLSIFIMIMFLSITESLGLFFPYQDFIANTEINKSVFVLNIHDGDDTTAEKEGKIGFFFPRGWSWDD